MKRFGKKVIAIILVLTMVLPFTGCSTTANAERAVEKMFTSFKKLDFEKAEKHVELNVFDLSALDEVITGGSEMVMKGLFSKLDYEILSSEQIDDETVNVTVKITSAALAPILGEFALEAAKFTFANIFDNTDEDTAEAMAGIFKEIMADPELKMVTSEVTIKVVKDGDEWKVASGDTLADVIFDGLQQGLESLSNLVL